MIGFDHNRGATAQAFGNERGDVAEIHQRRDLHARVRGREAEVVYGIMRDRKRMEIDLAHTKVFAGFNFFDAIFQRRRTAPRLFAADAKMLADVRLASFAGHVDRAIDSLSFKSTRNPPT